VIEELLDESRRYAERYESGKPSPPAKKLAVLACMDARLIPSRILGLDEGDAHILRNAGGIATDDAIRSLAVSQHLLGTEEVVVIGHTDCGLENAREDEVLARLEDHAGRRPPWAVGAFDSVEKSVGDSVAAIRSSPFLPRRDRVHGYVFEVETGRLREVAA
jgi:carbonic anhydrase